MAKTIFGLASVVLLALSGGPARASGSVVVYCGVNEEWCRAASTAFEKKTGIHVDMTRQSAGEIFARLRAERPIRAATSGSAAPATRICRPPPTACWTEYQSPHSASCTTGRRTRPSAPAIARSGLYLGALGFGYNADELAKRKIAGARLLGRPDQARVQGRGADGRPQRLRHGLDHAGDARAAHGRGPGVRLSQEA